MFSILLAGITSLSLLTPALPTPALPTAGGGEAWMDDLGPALQRASAEGKDVLVDFTGSDWCGWCIRLDKEVFTHDEFLDWVQERFVLVALDFPREGGEVWKAMTPGLRARNQAQNTALGVTGFPTVMLMTADGLAYNKTGYQAGGPGAYIKHLAELQESPERQRLSSAWKRVQALIKDPAAAPTDADREAVFALLGRVSTERDSALNKALSRVDPDDSQGIRARRMIDAFVAEHLGGREVDVAAAAGALEALLLDTPSVVDQAGFHFYRGLLAADRGDAELAAASLVAFDRIGDLSDGYRQALTERIAGMDADGQG